jgi:short subunit dehydrogenase-like uncharacterized protein
MSSHRKVVVFGAYGHTGRFIVAELVARGLTPVLAGRDPVKLRQLQARWPDLAARSAAVASPVELDIALAGADAVINAAGPFSETAVPLAEAALRARIPYLDIVAEPDIAEPLAARFDAPARIAGIPMVMAVGFYGGLGDLLVTAALGDWREADEVTLAYALSSWKPTAGTRRTIEMAEARRGGQRLVWNGERFVLGAGRAPESVWTFPSPVGAQPVVGEFATADCVSLSRHLRIGRIHQFMTTAPLGDLSNPDFSPPAAVDARGRSAQTFMIEALAERGGRQRRAVATGQDIYAVTAPLVVEAVQRLMSGTLRPRGVTSAAALGDATEFLSALAPTHLQFEVFPRS